MEPLALGLVLVSAFLHAAWNALIKRAKDTASATLAALLVCTGIAVAVALVTGSPLPRGEALLWALASGLFETGYIATLSVALARAPLGPVYTVQRGGALLVIWPVSVLLLGELINLPAVAGTVLVAGGLALVGFGDRGTTLRSARGGLAWAAVCAVFVAGYHLSYKQALGAGGAPAAVFAVSLGVATPINLLRRGAPAMRRVGEALRAGPILLPLAGLLAAASFLSLLHALERQGAGAVVTLRNTSILFAQGLAWAIGDRPTRAGLLGAILVAAGAVVLGLR